MFTTPRNMKTYEGDYMDTNIVMTAEVEYAK